MPRPILNTTQSISGIDVHTFVLGEVDAPMPHYVVWSVGYSEWDSSYSFHAMAVETSKAQRTGKGVVRVGPGHAVARAHDAGPHGGHICAAGVNQVAGVIERGSGSKAEYGSSQVKLQKGMMAVNAYSNENPQLHCQDPLPPAPIGHAWVNFSSVVASFTNRDRWIGMQATEADAIATYFVNMVAGAAGSFLGDVIEVLVGVAVGVVTDNPLAGWDVAKTFDTFLGKTVKSYASWEVGAKLLGSPLGWSSSDSDHLGDPLTSAGDAVYDLYAPILGLGSSPSEEVP